MNTRMTDTLSQNLRELIAALERRVPRLEREGESDITRDAEALKYAALKRIAELERTPASTAIAASAQVRP